MENFGPLYQLDKKNQQCHFSMILEMSLKEIQYIITYAAYMLRITFYS